MDHWLIDGNGQDSRPDVEIYTTLVLGSAALLRVSDALRMMDDICRVGVSPGEEVPFGKVVRCPICTIAVGVAQPQLGIQIVCCSKCRYKYELVSGNIVLIQKKSGIWRGVCRREQCRWYPRTGTVATRGSSGLEGTGACRRRIERYSNRSI